MNHSRHLDPVEQVLWKLDRAGSMNFTMVVELDAPLDPDSLRNALEIETVRNPRLGARIGYDDESAPLMLFDPLLPTSLRVVERKTDDTWCSELEYELNQPFNCEREPLSRTTLVQGRNSSELLITLHHAIGDATSGILLVRDILKLMSSGERLVAQTDNHVSKTFSIVRSIGLDKTTFGFRLRMLGFGAGQLLGALINPPKKLAPDAHVAPSARKTRVIHKVLTAETTALVRRASKEFGTTVHGALCAAMVIAAYSDVQSRRGKWTRAIKKIACMSPVDMRKYGPESSTEDIGFFVSTVVVGDRVQPDTSFWCLANQIATAIHKKIGAGEPLMSLALQSSAVLETLPPDKLASRVEDMIAAAVGVTNIGQVDIEEFDKTLFPRSIHFAAAVNAIAGTGFLCSAVTFREKLTLNFQYASPLISDARADQLATLVLEILRAAATNQPKVSELLT